MHHTLTDQMTATSGVASIISVKIIQLTNSNCLGAYCSQILSRMCMHPTGPIPFSKLCTVSFTGSKSLGDVKS